MLSIDQKIQRKADKNVSKAIVIKRLREEGNRNINDDFGLNYLPKGDENQTDINKTDLEIGDLNPANNSVLNPNVNVLEEGKVIEDDDFNLGMRQFLSYNKQSIDMSSRSRSDGNFLQDLHKDASVNSDGGKKKLHRNLIHKTMTPKSTDHANRLEQQIIMEHQNEETVSQSSKTDSELDSIGEVSSDSGEYRDLPIVLDAPQGETVNYEDE